MYSLIAIKILFNNVQESQLPNKEWLEVGRIKNTRDFKSILSTAGRTKIYKLSCISNILFVFKNRASIWKVCKAAVHHRWTL